MFASDLDVSATCVACILLHDLGEHVQREASRGEAGRIGLNDDLLLITATGVHLRHTGRAPEEGLYLVFLDLRESHELLLPGRGLVRSVFEVVQAVIKDLAETSGNRRELGRYLWRQLVEDPLQTFRDELTREIQIDAVLEGHRHL